VMSSWFYLFVHNVLTGLEIRVSWLVVKVTGQIKSTRVPP